jgi:hypothetical protein
MKKKEGSSGTRPDRAFNKKKMKSPGRMFESYPRDCHPITFHSFLRSFSAWNREGGRLDAITIGSGRRLKRRQSAQEKEAEVKRDGCKGSVCPSNRFHPLLSTLSIGN